MTGMTRAVFLSYRREETSWTAGRLADRLTDRLGSTQVFMDVDTVEPGADFADAIAREVAACDVLIALIGPTWSTIVDRRGRRRLDDPDDFVVLEIQAALERAIHVIPVLVDGAVMPDRSDLPEKLQGLARRHAVRLDHETFRTDVTILLNAVDRQLVLAPPEQPVLAPLVDQPKAARRRKAQLNAGLSAVSRTWGWGQFSLLRWGQNKLLKTGTGVRAADQAIDSGHADQAAVKQGMLLAEQGDVAGARAAYQRAIDNGHADVAPTAAVALGVLLAGQGDVAGARAAYQRAIDSGHAFDAPFAASFLGDLLAGQGDVAGARSAYQRAIDGGHVHSAPYAAVKLGVLLEEQGEVGGARSAYQWAIDSGHAEVAPRAAVALGVLLAGQGDVGGARAAFQRVIDSGYADAVPYAAICLGRLLAGQGDVAGARSAYQWAIDSGHADVAPDAANELGRLLAVQGDVAAPFVPRTEPGGV